MPIAHEKDDFLCRNISLDNAAFEEVFKQYFPALCTYCQFRFGFDIDEAKDVVHTGFIKLWERRHTLSGDMLVKPYLYKVIDNVCLDLLRHKKVRLRHEHYLRQNQSNVGIHDTFNHPDLKHLSADIDHAIEALPEQMRKVFQLSRYEGLKYSEIAGRLNISVKTVETQMSRALVKLRQRLTSYLPFYIMVFLLAI